MGDNPYLSMLSEYIEIIKDDKSDVNKVAKSYVNVLKTILETIEIDMEKANYLLFPVSSFYNELLNQLVRPGGMDALKKEAQDLLINNPKMKEILEREYKNVMKL